MENQLNILTREGIKNVIYSFLAAPIDRISIQLLTRYSPLGIKYTIPIHGVSQLINRIIVNEGYLGLWRYFCFELIFQYWTKSVKFFLDDAPLFYMGKISSAFDYETFISSTVRSFVTNMTISLLAYPLEVLGIKYVAQGTSDFSINKPRFSWIGDVFKHTIKKDGVLGLYQGYHLQIVLDVFWAIFTSVIAWEEQRFAWTSNFKAWMGTLIPFSIAWILTTPIETVLYRIKLLSGENIDNVSAFRLMRDTIKEDGIIRLYEFGTLRFLKLILKSVFSSNLI